MEYELMTTTKVMNNTDTLMEKGWDAASQYARKTGTLIGSIKSVLRFGIIDDNTFKVLAEAVIGTLDPESEFDLGTHSELIAMAEVRNIELDGVQYGPLDFLLEWISEQDNSFVTFVNISESFCNF